MTTYFRDDFTGAGSVSMTGSAPDGVAFGGNLWTKDASYTALTRTGGQAVAPNTSGGGASLYGPNPPTVDQTGLTSYVLTTEWQCAAGGFGAVGLAVFIANHYAVPAAAVQHKAFCRIQVAGANAQLQLTVDSTTTQVTIPQPVAGTIYPAKLTVTPGLITLEWFGQTLTGTPSFDGISLSQLEIIGNYAGAFNYLAIDDSTPPPPPEPKWTNYQNTYEVA